MGHMLGDSTFTLVRHFAPKLQKSCKDLAMSTVLCGIGSVEATISGQVPVYDAVAPPSVRTGSYRVAPKTLAYKAIRIKRRSHGGKGGGKSPRDDDGPEWDEGGFGGSSGWSGSDGNGRGGNDHWGASWNDEDGWWENASDAAFSFIYEVACWISLTQCLQFVLKQLLDVVRNGGVDPAGTRAFAQCSFVFVPSKGRGPALLVVEDQMPKLMWVPQIPNGNL